MHPLERYYKPLPQPPTNPERFIMNGLKMNGNLSSKKPQYFQLAVNSETAPSLPMYSRTGKVCEFDAVADLKELQIRKSLD